MGFKKILENKKKLSLSQQKTSEAKQIESLLLRKKFEENSSGDLESLDPQSNPIRTLSGQKAAYFDRMIRPDSSNIKHNSLTKKGGGQLVLGGISIPQTRYTNPKRRAISPSKHSTTQYLFEGKSVL